MAFGAAPSMACDSIRFPPQSRTAIATVTRFFSAQAVQPSTRPRAPAELRILMVRVGEAAGAAQLSAATVTASNAESERRQARMRMMFLPVVAGAYPTGPSMTRRGRRGSSPSVRQRFAPGFWQEPGDEQADHIDAAD